MENKSGSGVMWIVIILVVLAAAGAAWYYWGGSASMLDPDGDGYNENAGDTGSDTSMDDMDMGSQSSTGGATSGAQGGASAGVDVGVGVGASTGAVKEFTLTASNFAFAPKTMTVKKGDTVKVTLVNSGGTHDFVIDEFNAHTNRIQGGQSETVTFVADKAGSFEYYCSVGNHRAMGMKGTLTVTN